ncbi:helical backbone metal receptor [Pseudoalteromonas sp. G4]|uniref:helical backbone metal receptor n=1 Tax=Pseudoalteromonas sp. G4 TaxID=2992761 RepID=UPI00237EC59D|nr:helical backbone metal receptor [Pseudoalteromonas sp. G4]MDE3273987.1 helical backbone metal receptor [Pseudoalteromonas sp. G4]
MRSPIIYSFVLSFFFFFSHALSASPKRIATLAPHLTEWTYSLGSGDHVIAVSSYSDFPEDAKKHPIIADANGINLAKLVELNPDLVLVWRSNAKLGQIERMKQLGLNVFISDPHTLEDIEKEVTALGEKLSQQVAAINYTTQFKNDIAQLKQHYQKSQFAPAFFQLWHTPIMTANKHTLVNQIFEICGLENVFAASDVNYPTVNKEQVMLKRPEFIVISEMDEDNVQSEIWQGMVSIPAVKKGQIIKLNPDHLHRYTNRVLIAANELCRKVSAF